MAGTTAIQSSCHVEAGVIRPRLQNPEEDSPHIQAVVEVAQRAKTMSIDFVFKNFAALASECGKVTASTGKLCFDSPLVEVQGKRWGLSINPNGQTEEHTGFVSCFLTCTEKSPGRFSVTLVHKSDPNKSIRKGPIDINQESIVPGYGWNKFVEAGYFATHFDRAGCTVTFRVDVTFAGIPEKAVPMGQPDLPRKT